MEKKDIILSSNEAIKEISKPKNNGFKIGIGITTHNRYEIFKETYNKINEFLPEDCELVVVDDCSDKEVPESTYRFNSNVGIARAKNKCIELLYSKGCEHFFLFDDDCYPLCKDWYKPYINSGKNHLMYIFMEFSGENRCKLMDTYKIYEDNKIVAYSHARGCMCYYRRVCFDKAGGMSPLFGKWGWEHPDLSNRIYNLGLTPFKYMDVPNSNNLIYSRDEHFVNIGSTVSGEERQALIKKNSSIYNSRKYSTEYVDFRERKPSNNLIITCYFTHLQDFQRSDTLPNDKSMLGDLISSLNGHRLIVLNDCFDNEISDNVEYIHCETGLERVYYQRWVSILDYLITNKDKIDKVFCVDGTDVRMLHNPFDDMDNNMIYVGDEPEKVGCQWMYNHNPNKNITDFINKFHDETLLNAGLLGGSVKMIISFISKLLSLYCDMASEKYFNHKEDSGDSDMGLFNYVAFTFFTRCYQHGIKVNTPFKSYSTNNVSWFKHK